MKNKKIIIIFLSLFIIILIGGYFAIKYAKEKNEEEKVEEYTPQEEISEDQLRQTIVSLYFPEKETKELTPEARLVDIKEIINKKYEKIVNLLIEGPKNDKNERVIPENTKLLKSYMEQDCLILDFSSEILNYNKEDEKAKDNIKNSLLKSLTQLTEVNSIKILVNEQETEDFKFE